MSMARNWWWMAATPRNRALGLKIFGLFALFGARV